ncbi:MAG: hypothetical protein ACREGG_04790 [Candidatus Saccharimonadales bacterium]
MHILKRIALAISSPLFIVLLFATAFDVGFVRTATHPPTVKKLVADSGIYSAVVPSLLQQTKSISTNYGTASVSNPIIKNAANLALPPQFIQQNTEMAIDNVYQWLNSNIAVPNFNVDLSGSKALFANKVADAVENRLSTLPACSASQNRQIALSGQFDVFNATCSPGGSDPDSVIEQLRSSLASEQDFLPNTTINPANVKNGGSNQSIFNSQLKSAPKQFQLLKKSPFILGLLTILTGVGIIFLSSTWQKGLRHVGINLVVIGVIMLIFSWAFNRVVSTNIVPKIRINDTVLQQDIRNLVTDLAQQIDKNYWYFGAIYTVLGVAAIGSAEIYRRKNLRVVPAGAEKPAIKESPAPKAGRN